MQNGRKRLVFALTSLVLAASAGLVGSTPAHAQPDINDVKKQVDTLYRQAEQASENYNDAKLKLQGLQDDLGTLRADQKRQDGKLRQVRQQVQDTVVSEYEGQDLSAVSQVLVSQDPTAFLTGLSTASSVNDLQSDLYDDYASQVKALDIRRGATKERVDDLAAVKAKLAADKATVDHKLSDAKALLGSLEEKQKEALLAGKVATPSYVPVSGRAAAAVHYALAQVGKAYVYGAAGPSAFDCSGLTMMAWAQAGVSLPHSSSAQFGTGPHISEGDLQPGDLVFYYSPISHVGMYIGNGLIVNAENPSVGVKVIGLHDLPYVGAVRPG